MDTKKVATIISTLVANGIDAKEAAEIACKTVKKPNGVAGAPTKKIKVATGAKTEKAAGAKEHKVAKKRLCFWFNTPKGCNKGEECEFAHDKVSDLPESQSAPPCPMGVKCHYKVKCVFYHPVKLQLCNKFNTPKGCPFGEKCTFAHGEHELRKTRSVPESESDD